MASTSVHVILIMVLYLLHTCSLSQQQPTCNGVVLTYNYSGGYQIPPTQPANQPYRFQSTLTVLNNGPEEVKSWRVYVGFQHNEILVSADKAVLADATPLPTFVGNGTTFVGTTQTDLKTAIETAGDLNQMQVQVQLVGTRFQTSPTDTGPPLPANLTLLNDGYSCGNQTAQGNTELRFCCLKNATFETNNTLSDNFMPRQDGDLVIMYDVINTYDANYWAQVSISNHNPLAKLDSWKLSWDWLQGEFIYAMRGAYPYVVDTRECIFGQQGQYYQQLDFSQALNCERRPTIVDLPPTKANDTTVGRIPFCCRNGTILPPTMDSSRSTSVFVMQVYKMPPNLNRTAIVPPGNWKINGTFSSDFQCGNPMPVSPSQFPNADGLPAQTSAVASWQVVCNIAQNKETPKCCVTFSAFYNDSVVPCSPCACGCDDNPTQTCSAKEPALLLPPQALLVPFDNRTLEALQFAHDHRKIVPNPLPCGDNCGVSINWHILSDYRTGWQARITIFNWNRTDFPDWFAAVELDKAGPGLKEVYSFNGSTVPGSNNTIFMQGRPGLTYLLAERDSDKPSKKPPVPGMQQSQIEFSKKNIPGIDVAGGDGFPTKVIFNGEECALPLIRPTNTAHKITAATNVLGLLTFLALFLMQ